MVPKFTLTPISFLSPGPTAKASICPSKYSTMRTPASMHAVISSLRMLLDAVEDPISGESQINRRPSMLHGIDKHAVTLMADVRKKPR